MEPKTASDLLTVKDVLSALDRMEEEPTNFEANVLETLFDQVSEGWLPSVKQHRILCEMVEKYLDDPGLLRALQDTQHG